MRYLLMLMTAVFVVACSEEKKGGDRDVTSLFKERWNINEEVIHNSDGTITYYAIQWGGLVANFANQDEPENWSSYEKIVFEFAERTTVRTQIMFNGKIISYGSPGISMLSAPLVGVDVNDVKQVALQAYENTTIKVKRIMLKEAKEAGLTTPIWDGECIMGNWESGFLVDAEQFKDAQPGNVLEYVYTTDTDNPNVYYWQFRSVYSGTEETLEGNANELNEWGCATVGKGTTRYRITLTENDVQQLKKLGLYVNGYYVNVTECYLLQ